MSLSIVVPVFNSEASLDELLVELVRALEPRGPFEVVLVDDCSRDGSWAVIERLAARDPRVRGIHLMRNYGQHNALLCGVRAARHEVIVTLDDDLQNPPAEIPRLLDELDRGFDVVYGTPEHLRGHGLLRGLASRVTKLALQGAMGAAVARRVSAFRAFRTPLREAFAGYGSPFVNLDVLLTWGTTRFSSVPVRHDERRRGVSNYTLRKLVTHALNMATGFSTVPLQVSSLVGFAFTLFGLGILGYVLVRWILEGSVVPGFPFLASVIAIFSGAQLFALGVIGEYLARMHFRSMGKPTYVVRDELGSPAAKEPAA